MEKKVGTLLEVLKKNGCLLFLKVVNIDIKVNSIEDEFLVEMR